MKLTLLFLALAVAAPAQQTRTEITKATTEHDDSKPNSPEVPDVYTLTGDFERVVVVRLKYKTDLLDGLKRAVAKEQIHNAVILAGAGSVRNYHVHGVSNREFPSKNIYVKDPTHPADVVSMNGYVIEGRVHAHITLTDDQQAFGGHLEPGTEVFTFAIITIGVFGDTVDLARVDDKTYR
jgi:predicted DNA-binding protein with PD1-like motif